MRSSHLSLLSQAQHLTLNLQKAEYSQMLPYGQQLAARVESLVLSRIAGLLLSPAAAVDFTLHALAVPLTTVYAAGSFVLRWKLDFSLPREHLLRVQQSVAPILFAGPTALLHPYIGIFFSEPASKHFMWGVLLSGGKKTVQVVCSPLTSMREAISILDSAPEGLVNPDSLRLCRSVAASALAWEQSLEVLQSVDFFDSQLARKGSQRLLQRIDEAAALPSAAKFVLRRASVVAYLALATVDYAVQTTASVICLASGVLQLAGAKAPIYFEVSSSPALHLTNLVKAVIYPVGVLLGAVTYVAKPEAGLHLAAVSSPIYGILPLGLRLLQLRLAPSLWWLREGQVLTLPIIDQHGGSAENDLNFLPSQNSHMMYLLVQKTSDGYNVEVVERGSYAGRTTGKTLGETLRICHNAMQLRFRSLRTQEKRNQLEAALPQPGLTLKAQHGVSNCVVTNLSAAMIVANQRANHGVDGTDTVSQAFRMETERRFGFMTGDFYPFAKAEDLNAWRTSHHEI